MYNICKQMSPCNKGIILMVSGVLLLLFVLGILTQWIQYALIAGAIFMIIYGYMEAQLHVKIMKYIKNKEK